MLVGSTLSTLPYSAWAELSINIGHSTEFSDNAFLSETDTADKTEHRTWVEAGINLEAQKWQIDSEYRFTNVEASTDGNEEFPEEEEIAGSTQFTASAFKQRAELDIRHDRRVMFIQEGGRDLPSNQQIRDTASITPTLYLQNNSRQQIFFSGHYTNTRYDSLSDQPVSAIDNESIGLSFTGQRELSSVDTVGLRIERLNVEYDNNAFEDNEYTSLAGFYSAQLRRIFYSASLGVNRVETNGLDTLTGPTASLGLLYDAGSTQIGFYSQYFITDSSRGNLAGTQFNIDPESGDLGSGDARSVDRYTLISNNLTVDHSFSKRTLGFLRFELANEDYEDRSELDQTNYSLVGEIEHTISSQWDLSVSARWRGSDFDQEGALENTTIGMNVVATYLVSPRLSIRLDLGYRERNSDRNDLSFEEQAATLGFIYNLRP